MRRLLAFLTLLSASTAAASGKTRASLPWSAHAAEGGSFCSISVSAVLTEADRTNYHAVGACYIRFRDRFGFVPAEGTLATSAPKHDTLSSMEFLFPDTADRVEGNVFHWFLQVRLPDSATELRACVKPWNKISRARFFPMEIRSCEPLYDLVGSGIRLRRKVRWDPFHDTLSVRGRVTSADDRNLPAKCTLWLELASWDEFYLGSGGARHKVACDDLGNLGSDIPLPDGWRGGVATISAQTNSPVRIHGARVFTAMAERPLPPPEKPLEYILDVAGADSLSVKASMCADSATNSNKRGAIIAFDFRDEDGRKVVPEDLPFGQRFGSYLYVPTRKGPFTFERKVRIPREAAQLRMKVARFLEDGQVLMESLRADTVIPNFRAQLAAEAGTDAETKVRDWLGDDTVERIALRADNPALDLSLCGSTMGSTYERPPASNMVEFTAFPGVEVSPDMDWTMDPHQNRGWQLNFLSCYWIPFLGVGMPEDEYTRHCKTYWNAFWERNTYPRDSGVMTFSDHTCASRIEAALLTLYGNRPNPMCMASIPSLRSHAAKDRAFLYSLLRQLYTDVGLVEWYLRSHTYHTHNHNLIMARALLTFADSMPDGVKAARRCRRLALDTIQDHFNAIFEIDGFLREQSTKYNHWMALYFSEMYQYLKAHGYAGEPWARRISDIVKTDAALADFEGFLLPMGDGDVANVQTDIVMQASISGLGIDGRRLFSHPASVTLPESGIYSFKSPSGDRHCLVDISDVLKAHGHHDFGTWQYHANGVIWVTDLGGPYKYTTKFCRDLNASSSHGVVEPVGQRQMSGRAYGVEHHDGGDFWSVECRSNVYGPSYRHGKRILVRKDLSRVSVEDSFCNVGGATVQEYVGRIILGPDVHAVRDTSASGNAWRLEHKSGKRAMLRLSGVERGNTRVAMLNASWKMNTMFQTESLEYDIVADGPCRSAVEISHEPQPVGSPE